MYPEALVQHVIPEVFLASNLWVERGIRSFEKPLKAIRKTPLVGLLVMILVFFEKTASLIAPTTSH